MTFSGRYARSARARATISACAIGASLCIAAQARAAGTVAGTSINNVATASFDAPGGVGPRDPLTHAAVAALRRDKLYTLPISTETILIR